MRRPPTSVVRFFSRLHQWLYRGSRGRVFASLGPARVLVLESRGRCSGASRRSPLTFIEIRGGWVVAASSFGRDEHPAWVHVLAERRAGVHLRGQRYQVEVEQAPTSLREALWPRFLAACPDYARYQAATRRRIPLIVLRRV